MGQLMEIAKTIYNISNLKITVLESENDVPGGTTGPIKLGESDLQQVVVKYRLDFDNKEYVSLSQIDKIFFILVFY